MLVFSSGLQCGLVLNSSCCIESEETVTGV